MLGDTGSQWFTTNIYLSTTRLNNVKRMLTLMSVPILAVIDMVSGLLMAITIFREQHCWM